MRTIKKAFTLFCFLLSALFSFAQQGIVLSNFTATHQSGKVFLNWAIEAGSTCNGINIFRSVDANNFSKVGRIAGICGNLTVEQRYDFTDNNPVNNQVNYYRLEFGSFGFSESISVEVIYAASGSYQILPNPVSSHAKIYFNNDKKEIYHLSLFNLLGNPLILLSAKENYFDLNTINLKNGIYFFTILTSDNAIKAKGKLLIQH